MSRTVQRVLGGVVLLVAGVLSLPVSAFFLDGRDTENWVVPVQLLVMVALGAGLALALPGLSREGATRGRRAMTGAWWGMLATVVGVVLAWFALSGLRGA